MIEKVYVETSVIGAYLDERTDIVSSAQKYWTRIWWDELRNRYEAVVSRAVVDELKHPDFPHSQEALDLMKNVPEVPIEDEIKHIANPNKFRQIRLRNNAISLCVPDLVTPNQLTGD